MASKALTKAEASRREKFCLEYIRNGEYGNRAYQAVYGTEKKPIADATARTNAWRLLTNADIKDRIRELRLELHESIMVDHRELLQEAAGLAMFDPRNMFDDDGRLLTLDQMDPVTRKSVNEVEIILGDDDGTPFRMAKVKYGKDKRAYIDMLMKHYNQYEAHRVAGAVQPMTVLIHPDDPNL